MEPFGLDFESDFWQDDRDLPGADGKKRDALEQAEVTKKDILAKRAQWPPDKSKLTAASVADNGAISEARRKDWLKRFGNLVLVAERSM